MSTDTRIAELERDLKAARRRYDDMRADHEETVRGYEQRITELKERHEERSDTVSALIEQVEECNAQIERWVEAFEMVQGANGKWQWGHEIVADRDKWFNAYVKLLAEWNRFVPEYNAIVAPGTQRAYPVRHMGRPLAAGPGQVERIKTYREQGKSLRWIAEETNLGLQTVRTVLDKADGVDRTTIKRLEKIAPDRIAENRTKRAIRDIAGLPKRINRNLERNAELVKQAKGLK